MSKLIELYKKDLFSKKIYYDKSQEYVVNELNNLLKILEENKKQRDNIFFYDILKFFKKNYNYGLYIWGDVGRGKTYIMDLFFSSLSFNNKIRLHFHHFMMLIHEKLKIYSGKKDPLKYIAKWLYDNYLIICLDEFFVKDIGDAMNLSKLFYYLFELGVFFVITSNVMPDKLYENGLQRQKFLPTIYLFERFLKIININNNIDYRSLFFENNFVFFYTLGFNTFKSMKKFFLKLSNNTYKRKILITIFNRKILAYYVSDYIVWFDFNYICGSGRSYLDYIEISTLFKIIFLSGVRRFNSQNDDDARRFISLVDEFYDRKIKVIISFDCCINDLYNGELLKFDFKRTISRLNEMSSKYYLKDFNRNVF